MIKGNWGKRDRGTLKKFRYAYSDGAQWKRSQFSEHAFQKMTSEELQKI